MCARILLFYLGSSSRHAFSARAPPGTRSSLVIAHRKFKFNCKLFDFAFIDVLTSAGSHCSVVLLFDNIYLVYVKRIMCTV